MIGVGKKYNERNLRYMRQFYELFKNQIRNTSCSKLSCSHYREVLGLKNANKIIDMLLNIEVMKEYLLENMS